MLAYVGAALYRSTIDLRVGAADAAARPTTTPPTGIALGAGRLGEQQLDSSTIRAFADQGITVGKPLPRWTGGVPTRIPLHGVSWDTERQPQAWTTTRANSTQQQQQQPARGFQPAVPQRAWQ